MKITSGTRPAIIAVTGLAKEARIAAGPGVHAIAGGGNAGRLADALERELALGARAVFSFGIAGGLVDDVASGTWLVARTIVASDARWHCDAAWTNALAECLPESIAVDLAGVDAPVMESDAKRALHRATGAAAVDTESHIAAAIAASYGLPFAAFRVVADTARRRLPPVAAVALNRNARISGRAVLGSLARRPGQLPLVLRTAVDARSALRALVRARRRLGHGLACPDLGELLLDVS